MLGYAKEQKNLRKEQKEAIGLLSIGTFLEYFDLISSFALSKEYANLEKNSFR